jgi:hypothetical protein
VRKDIVTLVCTECLEEVSVNELDGQITPCCEVMVSSNVPNEEDYLEFDKLLKTSEQEKEKALDHVASMSSDSKKRRKTYDKPQNTWPGKLTPDTESYRDLKRGKRKSRKRQPPLSNPTSKVDITYIDSGQYKVEIIGLDKHPYVVHGQDRKDARKKARSYIRSRGTSITVAYSIEEGDEVTTITFLPKEP